MGMLPGRESPTVGVGVTFCHDFPLPAAATAKPAIRLIGSLFDSLAVKEFVQFTRRGGLKGQIDEVGAAQLCN